MIYVTHGYTTKEFGDSSSAMQYITDEMNKENLSYKPVFDSTENGIRVIVFQYYTLYTETFIIHKEFDLRRY